MAFIPSSQSRDTKGIITARELRAFDFPVSLGLGKISAALHRNIENRCGILNLVAVSKR